MRQAVAGILLTLTALAAAAPPAARAQGEGALGALEAVMAWRVNRVRDTTAFDACSMYDAAGRPAAFPAGIAPRFEHLIQGSASGCGSAAGQVRPTPSPDLHLVVIDSMRLGEAQGRISATVYRGDAVHREDYTLARGRQWRVAEMRMWGAETVSYVRPAACPAANEPARRVLTRFLTSADGAPIRARDGFAHASAANVRLLTDSADSAICQRLRNGLTFNDGLQRSFAFYEADGFYFVAAVERRYDPPRIQSPDRPHARPEGGRSLHAIADRGRSASFRHLAPRWISPSLVRLPPASPLVLDLLKPHEQSAGGGR